jgi:SpoVK/Ycf46/Vps4 family AAA+-type ATPase
MAYERLDASKGEYLFDENVTDDFSELGGLDKEIVRIKRHIDFRVRFPEVAAKYAFTSRVGILLYGLPGNGKTRIARCCAGYVPRLFPDRPCRFMHVKGSGDYSMWLGASEQKIIERFRAAREAAKDGLVIMFWDEIDAIAKRRGTDYGSGAPDRILGTLLSEIDGVVPLGNVLLLFATNRAEMLDPGLLRPGRTDEKIEIPTPNRRAADTILRHYLGRVPLAAAHRGIDELIGPLMSRLFAPNGDYAEVARVKLSDGRRMPVAGRELVSGAMFEHVVKVAARDAAVREVEGGEEGVLEEDLLLALEAEMLAAVALLAPSTSKSYVKSIPQDAQPIAIDPVLRASTSTFVRPR